MSALRCRLAAWLVVLLAFSWVGCRTAPPLGPVDLKQPGWTVHTGQAVWHLPQGAREIAGEVLVATRSDGQSFVQFTKTPFTLVVARSTLTGWEVEFPPQHRHYSGRGQPPKRVIWLWLARVLAGAPAPAHWSWHQDANGWELKNSANAEALEGYFSD